MTNAEKILWLMRDRQQWAFKDDRPFWKEAADVWERSMRAEAAAATDRKAVEATAYARAIAACEAVDIVGADECIAAIRAIAKEA